jgi:peptide methionine sulfoxide reductase MsrA
LTLLVLDVIDPFAVDRQGNDVGRQYRSGFYWPEGTQAQQEPVFRQALQELADREGRMPVAEVEALRNFYPAEQYHQDYLDKNPRGYCHISIAKMHNVRQTAAVYREHLEAESRTVRGHPARRHRNALPQRLRQHLRAGHLC